MLNDVDKEFDLPTEDENGEPIEENIDNDVYQEEEEEVEHDDEFYEANELKSTDEQEIDTIAESEEQFNEASEQLKEIYTDVLASGFITEEQLTEIEVLNAQVNEAYDDILGKEKTDIEKLKNRVEELKEGFVGASPDEILNILTENGTKCWLYKDDDDNVLIDGTSIPELTVLLNKFKMIATDGENEGEFALNPDFIQMVVKDTGTGDAVKSIDNMYYLSTSKYELIGGTWVSTLPTQAEQQGKFLWIKTVTTYMDTTKEPTETQPICVSSQDGQNGADGVDGKDGVSLIYKGEFTSHPSNPQNGWYYRNTSEGKTFVYQSGTWYQMTIDGQDGQNGNDGKDGFSIEYKGTMSNPPNNPKKNWTYKDPDNGIVYIYTGIAWEVMTYDGNNGTDGAPGADGLSVFCTYHDSDTKPATPTGNGTLNGWHTNWTSSVVWVSQKVSSSATDGAWGTPIKMKGQDGVTTYTWIKYADDSYGNGISDSPTNKKYIGFAYNKTTQTESNNKSDYTWSLIKGEKGDTGVKGDTGANGITYYTWIKYSDNANGNPCYDIPTSNTKYIGIAVNQTTASESSDYTKYTWSKFRGDDGLQGIQGPKGEQGIPGPAGNGVATITEEYYLSTSKTTQTGGSWVTTPPTWSPGKFIWTRSKIIYTNSSTPQYTKPICDSAWEAVNEVDIGGRNLLSKSTTDDLTAMSNHVGSNCTSTATIVADASSPSGKAIKIVKTNTTGTPNGGRYFKVREKLVAGETYSWSICVKGTGSVGSMGPEQGGYRTIELTSEYKKITHTFVATEKSNYQFVFYSNSNFNLTYHSIKLEEGNKPTGWTQAPEDSIKGIDVMYYLSTSQTSLAGGSWSTKAPQWENGKYMWSKTVTKYNDGTTKESAPTCIAGAKGDNGKTSYFHIKYSPVANPTSSQMTETPSTYIGTYVDYIATDSTDPTKYTWARFEGIQGAKGEQGIPGTNGANGKTSYLHIKYSNDGGKTFTSNNGETPGDYIGQCTDFNVNDPTTVGSYKWTKIKGEQGVPGSDGQDGVSAEEIIIQYAKNQSTTIAPTTGWGTSMPSYQEGYYLWWRTRVKWSNSSSYKYSTPICDSSWKAAQEAYSQIKQLKDKISLIVADGNDSSSIILTPLLINLISESDIKLSAKKILINGLLAGTGWQVDEEGNLDINDLNVRGNISCDSINVDNLISAGIPSALTQDISIKVNSGETISQYLDEIPWNLNGFNVSITLKANITENLELRRFQNGVITIYLNGYTLKGYIRGTFNGAVYNIYGGNSSSDETNIGAIKPAMQYDDGSYKFSLYLTHCHDVMIKNVKIYGKSVSGSTNSTGIGINQKSNVTLSNVEFIDCDHILRASYISQVFCVSSKGVANRNGWTASTGAQIFLGSVTQAGGKKANTYTSNNGQVYSNGVTFDAVQSDEKNDNTETTTPTVVKYEIFKPKYCDSYRSTVYNNWKKDGVARQGDWGYGDMNGCAFYGTQFEAVKGKNITKVTIQVTRSSNCGNSASVSHTFQAHTYASRPSGAPSYTTCNKTLSLAWGNSGIVTITDATVLAGIKAGTIKGFGIKSAYDKSHYSALTNWTVRIYYRE